MTYLIIQLTHIGNVAMTVPHIVSLSQHYAEDDFVIVSRKDLSAAFYGYDRIIFHQIENQVFRPGNILHLYKELMSNYDIDYVIDLQNTFRTKILQYFFRLGKKKVFAINNGYREKHLMALKGAKHSPIIKTEFERYTEVFQKAGLEAEIDFTTIPVNPTAANAIRECYGNKQGRWIGIAPFAKAKSNMLPYRVTKEIISRLSSKENTRIFLFGGGRIECEMLRQWSSLYPNVDCIAGHPLEQELELMRQLDLMLCPDSANQHLCALVGLKTISIWCGTHPNMGYSAWKQAPTTRIQMDNITCRPCSIHGTNFCKFGNYACQNITTEQIMNKIEETEERI